ncbi:hypothetical protein M3Y99_00505400 [Aphelenchoides fujianensis]|nr:hypothetical protein M3Y99_00505400 [Aphelenchoides fujianensis]
MDAIPCRLAHRLREAHLEELHAEHDQEERVPKAAPPRGDHTREVPQSGRFGQALFQGTQEIALVDDRRESEAAGTPPVRVFGNRERKSVADCDQTQRSGEDPRARFQECPQSARAAHRRALLQRWRPTDSPASLRLDFMTLKGVCVLNADSFSNSSRIHNLNIVDSTLNLKSGIFSKLSHVSQIQLRENRIGKIEEESFSGLYTIGSLQLQANHIGRMAPRAFESMENVGVLMFSYNTVREPLESPDCLSHSAHKLVFTENTLHCSSNRCWPENYCDRSEAFKALAYYKGVGCPPMPTTPEPPSTATELKPTPSAVFAADSDRQIGVYGSRTASSSRNFYLFLI